MNRMLQLFLACLLAISPAFAHEPLNIKPLVERTVDSLPDGTLYWRIENVSDIAAAQAAAGDHGSWLPSRAARCGSSRLRPIPKRAERDGR